MKLLLSGLLVLITWGCAATRSLDEEASAVAAGGRDASAPDAQGSAAVSDAAAVMAGLDAAPGVDARLDAGLPPGDASSRAPDGAADADRGGARGVDAGDSDRPLDAGDPVADATGTWVGYIDSFRLPSGSDAVELQLRAEPELGGEVMFGMGPAQPAPDPTTVLDTIEQQHVREAYAYPLHDVVLGGERVRFEVWLHEIWQGFCASLPPIEDDDTPGHYRCIPGWSFSRMSGDEPGLCYLTNPMTGLNEEFDCGQFWLCGALGYCRCDATACYAEQRSVLRFDLTVRGTQMRGTVTGVIFSDRDVYLEKR